MHNCKRTRKVLIDLVLGEMPPAQTRELLAELNDCAECQAEHAGITSALRVSRQALRSAWPTEEFWPGYHARLQDRLKGIINEANNSHLSPAEPVVLSFRSRLRAVLGVMTTSSVRVPVPAALAVLLLVGVLSFSARSRGQSNVTQATPLVAVETRTVHVPIIQEKVITQFVYVEKKRQRHKNVESPVYANLNTADVTAAATSAANGKTRFSLVGFKPTDQVNLTIFKGTYQDEK
jgi:anti-sigma factor RsiW